jgi:tetratricopeptide (TPR) repeat protein
VEGTADTAARLAFAADNDSRAAGWSLVAPMHDARQRNRPGAARAAMAKIKASPGWRELPEADWPHYSLAEIHALLGEPDSVRKYRKLDEAASPPESRAEDDRFWWDALEAQADGRWGDAARAYARAAEMVKACMPCGTFYAAHAFDQAGAADSAEAYYRAGVEAPATGEDPEDATFYPLALRRLGEFAEQRGDRASALGYYERFVDLWRDADPELQPEVAAARRRIAALTAEPRAQSP